MIARLLPLLFPILLLATSASAFGEERPRFAVVEAVHSHLEQLRNGGFVLYVRHSLTDPTRPDRVPDVDLGDCLTQRPLTEGGRLMAAAIGGMIRRAGIPIGAIHASPLCRTMDTAKAMFPDRAVTAEFNLRYVSNMTSAEKLPVIERTRSLLSEPPEAGTNRVVVAHGPNLADLIGYFPKDGTVVLFRPNGAGGFAYVASIVPAHWDTLVP